jgi:hypothetical protein
MYARTAGLAAGLLLIATGAGGFLLRLHQAYPQAAKLLATTFIIMMIAGCLLITLGAGQRRSVSLAGWGASLLGLGALWSTTLLHDHTVGSAAFVVALAAVALFVLGLALQIVAGVLGLAERRA